MKRLSPAEEGFKAVKEEMKAEKRKHSKAILNRLSTKVWSLIFPAVETTGSFNPSETMPIFEEYLTGREAFTVKAFFEWLYKNNKTFGSGNYREVYQEFLAVGGTK